MTDMDDNRLNDPQQMEDDLQMADERIDPDIVEGAPNVDPFTRDDEFAVDDEDDDLYDDDEEDEATGVLGDPLDENIGEDTGLIE